MSQAGIISVEGSDPQVPTQFDTDSGSAIPLDHVLEILGDNGITTSGSGNTVTISLTGGGAPIDEINVDASTAPGTDPVLPNVSGSIAVTGAQVASSGVGANVIRTNSLAANSYTIEVQQSGSAALANTALNGVSHFNSGQFSVANGFVSLAGQGLAVDSIALQTGTTPITPNPSGLVNFNGSSVASGTNPVRTNGTDANTMQLEVQTSQALAAADATKIGLSNFDSASFAVAATGFVTASGTGLGKTITGNTGGALPPTSGNWNILGNNTALNGFASYSTGSGSTLTVNSFGGNIWVVNPTLGVGTHQTIQAAVTAASAGDTVKVTAKSTAYTENITGKAGVNIVADTADAFTPNVTISGTFTHNTAGTISISGIRLQTNSAALLAVTGSAASVVNLKNCYLNCSNNTGITFSTSSASAAINIHNCQGNLGTTGIGLFAHSSSGVIDIYHCDFTNTGASQQANTASNGSLGIRKTTILNPITTSSTNAFIAETSIFSTEQQNVTAITMGGSSSQELIFCVVSSGSASAISISSATGALYDTIIKSSNTNSVTGAGTLTYSNVTFNSSSSLMNTTTQAVNYTNLGKYKASGQPAFSAFISGADNNVTGDGTTYTIGTNTAFTEIFDIGSNFNTNGTFTAPVTGRYFFTANIRMSGLTAAMTFGQILIVTTARTYYFNQINCGAVRTVALAADLYTFEGTCIADMTAGDTAICQVYITGGAKTADIGSDGTQVVFFQGYQIA